MSNFNKILLFFSLVLFIGVAVFIIWIQLARHSLEDVRDITIFNHQAENIHKGQIISLMLWNISYGGMPAEMDFFYSGGIDLMVSEKRYFENFRKIKTKLNAACDSIDMLLIQKVDTSSKRSYFDNQFVQLSSELDKFEYSYCLNFSVPYIPVPLDQPIGEVHSGMMTMSKFKSRDSKRIGLDSKTYFWPKRLFTAQRCMSVHSYKVNGSDKQLHILNVHLDSYDYQGKFRLQQLQQLWEYADSLENKGDYIIAGGGWNMNPPGFKKYRIKNGYLGKPSFPEIDSSKFFSGWKFDYRYDIPTSRSLKEAYRHGAISTTIKDFFICSPNISVLEVNTANQLFENSDHQAIYLEVFLKP